MTFEYGVIVALSLIALVVLNSYLRKNVLDHKKVEESDLIKAWIEEPLSCFCGYFGQPIEWNTYYGLTPDIYCTSSMPDLRVTSSIKGVELDIAYVERIRMHSGGTVTVGHFALAPEFTRKGHGKTLLNGIIELLRAHNAISIEFHESHLSKIEHYRAFFAKQGIAERSEGVWVIELYQEGEIPQAVLDFQSSLIKGNRRKI